MSQMDSNATCLIIHNKALMSKVRLAIAECSHATFCRCLQYLKYVIRAPKGSAGACLDHLQNRASSSSAQVVRHASDLRICLELIKGGNMTLRQIHHMDVISDARPISGRVVVSKNRQHLPLAQCNLYSWNLPVSAEDQNHV